MTDTDAAEQSLPTLTPDHPCLAQLATPALVLDAPVLMQNISRMAAIAAEAGVALRPHAKTHKSAQIARLQIEAGATGIACATLTEAGMLAAAGVPGLLVTSPVVGADKCARAARLNRDADIRVVVDHADQVAALRAALGAADRRLRVLVDMDIGQRRTGVIDETAGVALARAIADEPRVEFAGIQGYAGHVQHIVDPLARRAAAAQAAAQLASFAGALARVGLTPAIISGSGTGSHRLDMSTGPYNELQVGSYVFMDADYARIGHEATLPFAFAPSLYVLATVVSVSRPGEFTVDAGTKALATNGPPPCVILGAPPGTTWRFGGDEHGILTLPPGSEAPRLGTRLLIGATHCDPTVNLHASYAVIENGVLTRWPIGGRYGD